MRRSYAVITPARDEAANLPRLASCIASQTILPRTWTIVENGSGDETLEVAHRLAAEYDWVNVLTIPGSQSADRGAPVVRALQAGIGALGNAPDFVVNMDADISIATDYFERLLAEFAADPSLGIASGSLFESQRGSWRQRHVTGTTVVGAGRTYRWRCLQEILPFEERVGWDGIDEFKANARGWRTKAFQHVALHHHRREGERDGPVWRARWNQGHGAWYFGYRAWYLVLRALWHARREPAALAMILGYTIAALRREPRSSDREVRAYLRYQQSWRNLRLRTLEARGRRRT